MIRGVVEVEMFAGQLALIVAALFAGAALYVSLVEHPARRSLDAGAALTQWKPAYKRGAAIQAPLALIGFVLGLVAWWQTNDALWLLGAVVLVANWPWTLLVILPVNKTLLATDPRKTDGETAARLEAWAKLHAVRMVLGLGATVVFLWASIR